MRTIKGPAIFLAQFAGDAPPFNTLRSIGKWAAGLGFKAVQIPTWESRLFDLERAAQSKTYCDEIKGVLAEEGLQITELSTHLQGQLVAVHPAYDEAFDGFAPEQVRRNPQARQKWAVEQVLKAARASQNLGLKAHATFSGALAWPYLYPWPQRPAGLIETAFDELARRWRPILDAFDAVGVDVCYEIHPGEDLFDGVTFERFLGLRRQPSPLQHAVRPESHGAAAARLSRLHRRVSRRASRSFTSRTPSSIRRRSKASTRGYAAVDRSRRPLPLARRRPGRLQRHLLQAHAVRLRRLGSARMGVLHQASRNRAQPKARSSSSSTSSAWPSMRSTTSRAPARTRPPTAGCWA